MGSNETMRSGHAYHCNNFPEASAIDYPTEDATSVVCRATQTDTAPMVVHNSTEEVLRICNNGEVIWRGRLVNSDDDFKLAMLEMAATIKQMYLDTTTQQTHQSA